MDFGARLKKIRCNTGLSVRALAERVGVSPSFIYQLEKNETSPSFSTLRRIAAVLSTSVSVLTEDELPEQWVVVRAGQRRRIVTDDAGACIGLLAFLGSREKRMQPAVLQLEPGATCSDLVFEHERDDLFYVLEGELEFEVNGQHYRLESGDSAYFAFTNPTTVRNTGSTTAKALWVVSPPPAGRN